MKTCSVNNAYYYYFRQRKNIKKGLGQRSPVGEEIYEEFLTKFWLKPGNYVSGKNKWVVFFKINMIFFYLPESPFERACSGSVQESRSRVSLSSCSSNTRSKQTSDIIDLFKTFPPASRPV